MTTGNMGCIPRLKVRELRRALAKMPRAFDGCEIQVNYQEYTAMAITWSADDAKGTRRTVTIEVR